MVFILPLVWTVVAQATVRYVNLTNAAPAAPFDSWERAAVTIQDAVDAAEDGDEIVVASGLYQAGGRAIGNSLTNRVAVTRAVTLRSVDGPGAAIIEGYRVPGTTNGIDAVRCAWLTNGASLIGFTLRNGATRASGDLDADQSGAGVWCRLGACLVSNCVITGNSAFQGGGSFQGVLVNCVLTGNSASDCGGGAHSCTLEHCMLTNNSAANLAAGHTTAHSSIPRCQVTPPIVEAGLVPAR